MYSSGWNETHYVSQEILELKRPDASLPRPSYIQVEYHHAQPVLTLFCLLLLLHDREYMCAQQVLLPIAEASCKLP